MSKIKLIVTDLDGTLLNDDKRVSEYTVNVIQKAKQAGIKICIASGRFDGMLSIYRDSILGCDYTISCNGAVVKNENTDEYLLVNALSHENTIRIMEYFKEHQLTFMFYSPDTIYYKIGAENMAKRVSDYETLALKLGFPKQLKVEEVDVSAGFEKYENIIKIVAYENDEQKLNELRKFCESLKDCCMENTGYGIYGLFEKNVSKREGIEVIKKEMGIGNDAVAVFGDWENDLSMFDCADTRVAMVNGMDLVKERATIIAESNNDDGVAKIIETFIH